MAWTGGGENLLCCSLKNFTTTGAEGDGPLLERICGVYRDFVWGRIGLPQTDYCTLQGYK